MENHNPNLQDHWAAIYNESAYSEETLANHVGVTIPQLHKYISGTTKPRKKNFTLMIEAMKMALTAKGKIEFHPSYGYATTEQIARLREIGLCPERDQILKDIEQQTRHRGRSK